MRKGEKEEGGREEVSRCTESVVLIVHPPSLFILFSKRSAFFLLLVIQIPLLGHSYYRLCPSSSSNSVHLIKSHLVFIEALAPFLSPTFITQVTSPRSRHCQIDVFFFSFFFKGISYFPSFFINFLFFSYCFRYVLTCTTTSRLVIDYLVVFLKIHV